MESRMPNGDERGKRVTHHRQAQSGESSARERSQLERQGSHMPPRLHRRSDPAAQGGHHEDGDGERAIAPVPPGDFLRDDRGLERSTVVRDPGGGACRRAPIRAVGANGAEGAPGKDGGGQV